MTRTQPILLSLFAVLFLTACEKELSLENGGPIPGSGLLENIVVQSGSYSRNHTFVYDGQKKWIGSTLTENQGGALIQEKRQAERDEVGRLSKTVTILLEGSATVGDTLRTLLYRSHDGLIDRMITTTSRPGSNVYDSTTVTYNADARPETLMVFRVSKTTGAAQASLRKVFAYKSGNLFKVSVFRVLTVSDPGTLLEMQEFEFDNKPAALVITDEEYLSGMNDFPAALNNVTRAVYRNEAEPGRNRNTLFTYEYDNNGKPLQALVTITNATASITATATYTYR